MRSILPLRSVQRAVSLIVTLLLAIQVAWAQVSTYYQGIDTASATFVSDLHNLVYPHTKLSYSITKVADIAARDTTGGQKYVDCVYSGHREVYTPPWSWGTFSREHTWCHSWMPTYSSTSGPEYSDLHHLFPTHQNNANGRRSNHPLGVVVNVSYQYLDGKLGTNAGGQVVYEPRDQQKGDAARALFYMATAYHGVNGNDWSFGHLNTVTLPALSEAPQDVELLKQWHAQDPPDPAEVARNDSVQKYQGNRNPFVDHPEYAKVVDFVTMTKWSGGQIDTSNSGGGTGGSGSGGAVPGSAPQGMAVVVNEYYNTSTAGSVDEWVELVVLQDNVDLRGVRIRDHSNSGVPQTPFQFSSSTLWSSVAHGTIIVLLQSGSAVPEDTDPADKVLVAKTNNSALFAPTGSFSIGATSDAIQILTADSVHIHALGHGTAVGALPLPRAIASGTLSAPGVVAFLEISDSADFKLSAKAVVLTSGTFGMANDGSEDAFLATLLPVQVESFQAALSERGVLLRWRTVTEADNLGFEVERRSIAGAGTRNPGFMKVGFVAGAGTSTSPREYSFADAPAAGRYAYRLKQIDRTGVPAYTGEIEVEVGSGARRFHLAEPYPNPFNPSTSIEFSLAAPGLASLTIYTILGQEVASLFNGPADAGRIYRVSWNAEDVPSGLYFSRLQSGTATTVKRLLLTK